MRTCAVHSEEDDLRNSTYVVWLCVQVWSGAKPPDGCTGRSSNVCRADVLVSPPSSPSSPIHSKRIIIGYTREPSVVAVVNSSPANARASTNVASSCSNTHPKPASKMTLGIEIVVLAIGFADTGAHALPFFGSSLARSATDARNALSESTQKRTPILCG